MKQDITSYLLFKLEEIDKQIKILEAQKDLLSEMSQELSNVTEEIKPQAPVKSEYNSNLVTGDLILEILKKNPKLKAKEIFEIFHTVKPEIAIGGYRTRLARLVKSGQVKLKNFKYWIDDKD